MIILSSLFLALAIQVTPTARLDAAVEQGVRDGVYPGAVVVVGTGSDIVYAKGYGHFTWSASSPAPDPAITLFDLASLTKVVATTPAMVALAEAGEIRLDERVQRYLPEFKGEGKDLVTVRELLEHRSGLRAFLPLNEETENAQEARQRVLDEPLRFRPGTRVVYSDLNAMLLGWIVERVSGLTLDQYAKEHVFQLAGMLSTRYQPPRGLRERIAPVGLWRGHAIAGEVHDQNAARLGGVSGHAGLYSTGSDLGRYAQVWLNEGRTASGVRLFLAASVEHFIKRGAGGRALGWESRDTTTSDNTGTLLSASAYGHTGYTGTSMWIDPERGMFVVLLTNRVFAPRVRNSITQLKRIRGEVADAAVAVVEAWNDRSR